MKTRRFQKKIWLFAVFLLSYGGILNAQSLDSYTSNGGLDILRETGFADRFDRTLESFRSRVRKPAGLQGDVIGNSAADGTRLSTDYRNAWLDYLESKGATRQSRDFLGRPAGSFNNGADGKVHRLGNYEFWLETKQVGGRGVDIDLVVWELEFDGNNVKSAKGVAADLHTRHPLDRWAGNGNREHFRHKVVAGEGHIQTASNRNITATLDLDPDRSFYWKDELLDRGTADRYSPAEVDDPANWSKRRNAGWRDREGFASVRDAIGSSSDGKSPLSTEDPRFRKRQKVSLNSNGKKSLKKTLTTLGVGAISIGTMEAAGAAEAFAKRGSKVNHILKLGLYEDWETLDRFLNQSGLANQIMLEFAIAGSSALSVSAQEFIDLWKDIVRRAKRKRPTFPFDGPNARLHLGDGNFAESSTDADKMTLTNHLDEWGGRLPIPSDKWLKRPRLVIKEVVGADHPVNVWVNDLWIGSFSNGRSIVLPIPFGATETEFRIKIKSHRNSKGDLDDIEIVEPAINYEFVER